MYKNKITPLMMKKLIVLLFLIAGYNSAFSQCDLDRLSFESNYPIPIGDNFINNSYNGIIDLGIGYTLLCSKIGFRFGIEYNSTFIRSKRLDILLSVQKPKMKFEWTFNYKKLVFIPKIGFGYTSYDFFIMPIDYIDEHGKNSSSGWIYNHYNGLALYGATKLVFRYNKRLDLYFQFGYEFTKLEKPDNAMNTNFNRNINMLYPGIGVIWKIKEKDNVSVHNSR